MVEREDVNAHDSRLPRRNVRRLCYFVRDLMVSSLAYSQAEGGIVRSLIMIHPPSGKILLNVLFYSY